MAKYIQKVNPVRFPMEVIQWKGNNKKEIEEFLCDTQEPYTCSGTPLSLTDDGLIKTSYLILTTPLRVLVLRKNDMLLKNTHREIYKCDLDYFNDHYEELDRWNKETEV